MLQSDPPRVRRTTRSVCLAATTDPGLGGSILDHTVDVALTLAERGWRVHFLGAGAIDRTLQDRLEHVGVACTWLNEVRTPAALTLDGPHLCPALHDSDRVRFALDLLHGEHHFDLIVFPERGGLGFRTIQAKATGQAFPDVSLAVTLHGPSPALRHAYQQWLNNPRDLTLDYAERYAFEHADVQWAALTKWQDEAARLGWRVDAAAQCLPETGAALDQAFARAIDLRRRGESIPQPPLVTVSVAYCNLPEFLDETLAALAVQTYPHLEVLVIDDGSDEAAAGACDELRGRYPLFRFLRQDNQGIGATRNRGLAEARGDLFLPVDADNVAHPDMVRRFVLGMQHRPEAAALTCYFLAFTDSQSLAGQRYAYAYKPTGGPRVLGSLQNVYGDGNAIFRTEALRAVGGFSTERDTSFEDWEAFVKLAGAGRTIDVVPEFLFYYRHRETGFSRTTSPYRNQQRVLRRYAEIADLSEMERAVIWNLLAGYQQRLAELENANQELNARLAARRYRVVDKVQATISGLLGQWSKPKAAEPQS